jgi:hypothetical protein
LPSLLPSIFEASGSKDQDLKIQERLKGHWINFANGDDQFEEGRGRRTFMGMRRMGRCESVGRHRNLEGWRHFDGLMEEQRMVLSREGSIFVFKL